MNDPRTVCSSCNMCICIFDLFPKQDFSTIVPVPGHCFAFLYDNEKQRHDDDIIEISIDLSYK